MQRSADPARVQRAPITPTRAAPSETVILFDVMDTLVDDPFYKRMPAYFSLTFDQLLSLKHPTAWVDFESARITEDEFFSIFFKDKRPIDKEDFVQRVLLDHYEILPGMDPLLQSLNEQGYDMRAFSNYPVWYEYVEQACGLSRYLEWEFVSCKGLLAEHGLRKPAIESFEVVWAAVQGLETNGELQNTQGTAPSLRKNKRVLFVDDRPANVEAATRVGMEGILFEGADSLKTQLRERGIVC